MINEGNRLAMRRLGVELIKPLKPNSQFIAMNIDLK